MTDRKPDYSEKKTNRLVSTPIDSESLKKYLTRKFKPLIDSEKLTPSLKGQNKLVIQELHSMGIDSIEKLDNIVPVGYIGNPLLPNVKDNFLGLLRNILLIYDADAYFEKAWRFDSWNTLEKNYLGLLKSYNPNIENILRKHNIDIQQAIIID
jgi:putative GTP pyrophosphokinase